MERIKRIIFFTGILVVALFFTGIFLDKDRRVNITLKMGDEINIHSKDIKHRKGILILNDSIATSGMARQYEEISAYSVVEKDPPDYRPSHSRYIPTLYDLSKPYHLIKKRNNDTLVVIKSSDTLYFKFVDPDYKDPNDPTFSDLFERLFNSSK